ncbi:MAG TPA: tetratricopeptide repeat protein [Gemmatimonadales bacterium]|nr:tetratricopeptide repeat protein [Gemmatimonadales bacterium]
MRLGVVVWLFAGTLKAQAVPRPKLAASQDSNSAFSYFMYGMSNINQAPLKATQGFYWATRLDPGNADAWYGLWVASILSFPDLTFASYIGGAGSHAKDSVLHAVDSLRDHADYLNPLLHHSLDERIIERIAGGENLNAYIFGNPDFAARLAFARGDFPTAVARYERAIKQFPKETGLRWERGRAFIMMGQYDSALAEMHAWRDSLRARQETHTEVFLEPHEQADYAIGRVEELKGSLDSARREFENALVQDLTYLPAQFALARLALTRHDTTAALRELEQATQVTEADRCYTYGVLLWASRKPGEAAVQFTRAIAADSDYAPPYISLAYLVEASGDDSLAAVLYRNFIARAPKVLAPQLQTARQHLAAIEAKKP